jgi:outer membrane protein OmpA-like peptidoglycan-associated protein
MTPAAGEREMGEQGEAPTGEDTRYEAAEPSAVPSETERQGESVVMEEDRGFLVVGDRMRATCNLPDTRSEAPQFDFDKAMLRSRGREILDSVAKCMREGTLKGQNIVITGHADPRGTDAYNQRLGARRAEAARHYLVGSAGIDAARIEIRSRGEQQASGDDPKSWQLDRRVEVDVAAR